MNYFERNNFTKTEDEDVITYTRGTKVVWKFEFEKASSLLRTTRNNVPMWVGGETLEGIREVMEELGWLK